MDVVFYAAGIIVLIILAGVAVGALLASHAGRKRREELHNRYLAQQPWDAQSR